MKLLVILTVFIVFIPAWLPGAQFEDALGRKVMIEHPPQRIISLVPAVTEILFKLKLQDRLVATTDYCNYPEAAQKLPKIGQYSSPSLESILRYKPDLVIASASMNRPSLIKRLEAFNIPAYVIYPQDIGETLQTMTALGEITERQQEAQAIVAEMLSRISTIATKIKTATRPSVLTFIMLEPLTVAGPGTYINDLIERAGGRNVVPPGPSHYPTWGDEALLTYNPDVIIVSSHPGQPDPQQLFQQWPQLKALKEKRVFVIEADWLHRPGPRMVLGLEALAKALHPDINFDD